LKYDYINKNLRGIGIPHVDPNVFWKIDYPLAPLSEQQRIVAKLEELLSRLDAGTESLNTTKTMLNQYKQKIFINLIVLLKQKIVTLMLIISGRIIKWKKPNFLPS